MSYWHEITTKKSFEILKDLQKKYQFILIGGWACYFYTKSLKSKDIDLVLEYDQLEKFRRDFGITKNSRLKKYETKIEDINIDIYVPFYSNPGIPAEEIKNYTTIISGFTIPVPEVLLILKQKAYKERKDTLKGEKDKIDIFSLLLKVEIDFKFYKTLLKKYNLDFEKDLRSLLDETFEVKEIALSRHKMAKLKKRILEKLEV